MRSLRVGHVRLVSTRRARRGVTARTEWAAGRSCGSRRTSSVRRERGLERPEGAAREGVGGVSRKATRVHSRPAESNRMAEASSISRQLRARSSGRQRCHSTVRGGRMARGRLNDDRNRKQTLKLTSNQTC